MNMLNFGCGARFHKDWVNIDFSPIDNRVQKVNLLGRLPFSDNSFDVAYSSHFLEHITPKKAYEVLGEIKRVLKPNGVLRIVVPDLENMAKAYLSALQSVDSIESNGGGAIHDYEGKNAENIFLYDWIMLEIFDQMVRMQSGGEMQRCFDLVQETQNKAFNEIIKHRVGEDLLTPHPHTQAKIPLRAKLTLDKIINKCLNLYLKALRLCVPKSLRDEIFINTSIGERHKWSYDRFSLARLLHKSGFTHITQQNYTQSQIPHFNTYLLDINTDNTPYKGVSSLYMECIKP